MEIDVGLIIAIAILIALVESPVIPGVLCMLRKNRCPLCGAAIIAADSTMLTTNPPQVWEMCVACEWHGHRVLKPTGSTM